VREYREGDIEIAANGRDDREYGSKRRNFGRIDPFCLFAVVPMVAVGVALVFSDVPVLAPVMILLAGLVVLLDSWLHRPGRLIDPRVAKDALRRSRQAEGGGSEVRRGSRYDTGSQSQVRSRSRSTQGGGARQQQSRQQPRQRQATAYRNEPQRGRSRY
jgi:hypothetical protein